jgi:spore germination protein GerM
VSPSASAADALARGRVWGARDGRLVPVFAELQGTGTASRVRAVLSLADPDKRLPSALPPGTRLLQITRSGDTIVLTLSQELRGVPAKDLPLALAQLVFTVTERPEVRRVHVRADQAPIVYVDATGRRIGRALVRSDFAELVQGNATD